MIARTRAEMLVLLPLASLTFMAACAPRSAPCGRSQRVGMEISDLFAGLTSFMRKDGPVAPDLADSAPSWDALKAVRDDAATEEERAFRGLMESGRLPHASALAKQRLFDLPEGEAPRVTFYRDTAAWCPYCEKVWLVLEEKRVPYEVKKVNMNCYGDKPAWFWAIQPSGGIPVAKLDGQARPLHFPDTPQSPPKIPRRKA